MKQYKNVLKHTVIWLALVGLLGIGLCTVYVQRDKSLDPSSHVPKRIAPEDWDEYIKIGVIGDSWVAGQKLDQAIEQTMMTSGVPTEVISQGHPGAKSRQIYRNLLNKQQSKHSSNHILMDEEVDYLVVVAGVNDTAGHIGAEFYAHHIFCIIQAALDRGIRPIVVEVPEYGIEETPTTGLLSSGKSTLYFWLFDDGKVDVIREYRKALRDRIPLAMTDKVVFVKFASITEDYSNSKSLYANPSHLNRDGYEVLGDLIAKKILESHSRAKAMER